MKQAFDAIIIGFGKGGKTLAGSMASKGLNIALVEKSSEMYGGTCINKACIPTKKLENEASKVKELDLKTWEEKENFYKNAIESKDNLIATLRGANYKKLNDNDNITIFNGEASFIDGSTIKVKSIESEDIILSSDKVFINTGTEPFIPEIKGIKEANNIYTSNEILELKELPKTLTIIGAGFIGLEFASIYSGFGSKVTVINTKDSILSEEDNEDREAILENFNKKGVKFINNARAKEFKSKEGYTYLVYEAYGATYELKSEAFLVATGRKATSESLNLKNANVKVNSRGFIEVSDTLQTSNSNIWAIGDINGGAQFTYISLDDYRIIESQLFEDGKRTISNRPTFPRVMFLDPAFSRVGLNVKEAKSSGYNVEEAIMSVASIPRAKQIGKTEGFLKVIIDSHSKKVLGASLFSEESSELIHILQIAVDLGLPYTYLRDQIYAHPTMAEAFNDLLSPTMIKKM